MFKTLAACLLAIIGCLGMGDSGAPARPSAGAEYRPSWWNGEWSARAKVTVDSGFYERQGLVLSREVNFDEWLKKAGVDGAFDPNSPRVVWLHDGQQEGRASAPVEEVPSRFIPDKGSAARGTMLWQRPGVMATMTKEPFFIYFDALRGEGKPALKPCSLEAPANLIVNGGFEEADPKAPTRPLGWEFQPKSDAGTIEWIKDVSHSGRASLRLTGAQGGDSGLAAEQWVKVREGRRYALSGWIKCADKGERGWIVITARFYGPDRKPVPTKGGVYGNYKTQPGCSVSPGETPWLYFGSAEVGAYDPALKDDLPLPGGRLAPGTAWAVITVGVSHGKLSALFDDLEFKEVGEGEPVDVTLDAVEKK